MAKKNLTNLGSFTSSGSSAKAKEAPKKTEAKPILKQEEKVRKTFKLNPDLVEKLEGLSFWTFKDISEVLEIGLETFFNKIETTKKPILENQESAIDNEGKIKLLPEGERQRRRQRYKNVGNRRKTD